jgi:hypothetical protein
VATTIINLFQFPSMRHEVHLNNILKFSPTSQKTNWLFSASIKWLISLRKYTLIFRDMKYTWMRSFGKFHCTWSLNQMIHIVNCFPGAVEAVPRSFPCLFTNSNKLLPHRNALLVALSLRNRLYINDCKKEISLHFPCTEYVNNGALTCPWHSAVLSKTTSCPLSHERTVWPQETVSEEWNS